MGMVWLLIPMIGLILLFIVVGYFIYKKYQEWKENKAAQAAQVSSVTSSSVAIPTPVFSISPTIFNSSSDDQLAENTGEAYFSATGARIPGQPYVSNLVMPPALVNEESEVDSLYDTTDSEKRRVYPVPIPKPVPRVAQPNSSSNINATSSGQNSKAGGEMTGTLSESTESGDDVGRSFQTTKSIGGEISVGKNAQRTPGGGFKASPIVTPEIDHDAAPQMLSTAEPTDEKADKKVLSPKGRYVNASNMADTALSPQNDFFQIEQFPPLDSSPLEFVESESLSIENPFKKPRNLNEKHHPLEITEGNNGTPPRNQKRRQSKKTPKQNERA